MFSNILYVGPDFKHPRGGVAQVLNTYSQEVCNPFRCIVTTSSNWGKISKLLLLGVAWVDFILKCLFGGINIVHIHTASNLSFWRKTIFIYTALFLRKKIVLHVHGGQFKQFVKSKHHKTIINILNKCDSIVCLSDYWKSYFCNELCLHNVKIIPNVINEPDNNIMTERKKNGECRILFLGLICKNKGIYDLLKVITGNRDYYRGKLKLLIGGNGEIEKLNKIIKDYDLDEIVDYLGWISGQEKAQYIKNCDYFILPSYIEGVPISILEAMSYAKPILATNVGGIPEIVKDRYNGLLFSPGDLNGIDHILKNVLENEEDQGEMGRNSLKMVRPYLPSSVRSELIKLYTSLIN